ncbi:hypothetical protein I3843_12G042300 [Carya illinoinensis]|uniref:Uncharacterized protein n=1 Tax=Carya illinoinensis TaxID=32201 RepID=A0A922IW47_CARIL|nr:hypothetical protein I3842_12G040900 [Carya illinoinensis]KAG7952108.1 hypothetical protein I3843_12G042300 [Carya illinoinensis]
MLGRQSLLVILGRSKPIFYLSHNLKHKVGLTSHATSSCLSLKLRRLRWRRLRLRLMPRHKLRLSMSNSYVRTYAWESKGYLISSLVMIIHFWTYFPNVFYLINYILFFYTSIFFMNLTLD